MLNPVRIEVVKYGDYSKTKTMKWMCPICHNLTQKMNNRCCIKRRKLENRIIQMGLSQEIGK